MIAFEQAGPDVHITVNKFENTILYSNSEATPM